MKISMTEFAEAKKRYQEEFKTLTDFDEELRSVIERFNKTPRWCCTQCCSGHGIIEDAYLSFIHYNILPLQQLKRVEAEFPEVTFQINFDSHWNIRYTVWGVSDFDRVVDLLTTE